jgi:hypothetical protein
MYRACQGDDACREQYVSGPWKGAWRDAVYKRAYHLGVDPTQSLVPVDHHQAGNPDWQMGYEDGKGDLELYEAQSTNKLP